MIKTKYWIGKTCSIEKYMQNFSQKGSEQLEDTGKYGKRMFKWVIGIWNERWIHFCWLRLRTVGRLVEIQ